MVTISRTRQAGRALGLAHDRTYGNAIELLDAEAARDDGADAVAIMTPNDSHHEYSVAALDRGFDVICDKPMTNTLAEALDLDTRVQESGLVFCLTHNYTGYPLVIEARERIAAGALGDLRRVAVSYLQDWLSRPEDTGASKQAAWRTDPAVGGESGAFADIGTHAFNLVEFVSGQEITEEELEARTAFVEWCRRGTTGMKQELRNSLSAASDSDGGFLIPPSFESGIIMDAYDMAEIRPNAQVSPTGRDTVYIGALSKPLVGWGRTNLKVTPQKLNAGVRRITIFDLKALALIHNNTLDDSDADIVGELSAAFSMAIAEAEDVAFAAGPGDDGPQGIVASEDVQANNVISGVAAGLTDSSNNGIDALISCFYTPKTT